MNTTHANPAVTNQNPRALGSAWLRWGRHLVSPCLALALALFSVINCAQCQPPQTQVKTLTNGIRLAVVCFPASTNVSLFTFSPLGLASDAAGQAQWAHLVEHLIVRSTVTGELVHANGETLPDHQRLDTYGTVADWKTWLGHHRRWLEGTAFTQASLQAEKPRVIAECEWTAKSLATHKFALAAWAQGYRQGKTQVALKGDVLGAELAKLQALRDEHFAVPGQLTVCLVGGIEPATALAGLESELGGLKLKGTPVPKVKAHSSNLALTWDLPARHLVLTWPIPDCDSAEYAALMVAAQLLNVQFASAPELQQQTGMVFCGADLVTPEGNFFYLSAPLRPGADAEAVRKQLLAGLTRLAGGSALTQAAMFGQQLSFSLTQVADPGSMKSSLPAGVSLQMVEGNIGLMFGLNVHRYGARRELLAQHLAALTPGSVKQAVQKHLAGANCLVCTIRSDQ